MLQGIAGPKEKMYYLALTKQGVLIDDQVTLYNEGTRNAVIGQLRATERAEFFRDFLEKNWPLFNAAPPGPIVFPADLEMRKGYVLAFTRFAQVRARDTKLVPEMHSKGCVCDWITDDVSQLHCGWCAESQRPPYNSKKQFCEHLCGRQHQK